MPRVPRLFMRVPLLRGLARLGDVLLAADSARRSGWATRADVADRRAPLAAHVRLLLGHLDPRRRHRHDRRDARLAAAWPDALPPRRRAPRDRSGRAGNLSATWDGRDEAVAVLAALRARTSSRSCCPVGLIADRLWPFAPTLWTPVVLAVLSLAVSMELWRAVQSSPHPAARFFLYPGLACSD